MRRPELSLPRCGEHGADCEQPLLWYFVGLAHLVGFLCQSAIGTPCCKILANVWAGSSHVSCTGGLQVSSPELQELVLLCGLMWGFSASCTFSRCSTSLLTTLPVFWLASVAFCLSLDSTARCNVSTSCANAEVCDSVTSTAGLSLVISSSHNSFVFSTLFALFFFDFFSLLFDFIKSFTRLTKSERLMSLATSISPVGLLREKTPHISSFESTSKFDASRYRSRHSCNLMYTIAWHSSLLSCCEKL